ncbi:hypothetical protein VCV18_008139 [Metarhizium anisopliae]
MQSKFATQIREIRTTVRSSGSFLLPGAKTVSRDIQHHGEFMRSGARAFWDIRDEDKVSWTSAETRFVLRRHASWAVAALIRWRNSEMP